MSSFGAKLPLDDVGTFGLARSIEEVAMRKFKALGLVLAAVGLLSGCSQADGAGREIDGRTTVENDDAWHVEARDYPYLGTSGRMVCELRTHLDADGQLQSSSEEYDFALMNDMLVGRAELEPELVSRIHQAGIANVATCDDARLFTTLRNAFELEQAKAKPPSQGAERAPAPPPQTPGSSSDQEEKVAIAYEAVVGYSVEVKVYPSQAACSGVLIAPNALITAQHCVTTAANQFVYVNYGLEGLPCVSFGCNSHPPSSWSGGSAPTPNARVYRFPGFTGTNDKTHDLALVINQFGGVPINWTSPADVPSSWVRMYKGVELYGDQFWLLGYGYNGAFGVGPDVSRVSNYPIPIESDHPEGVGWFTATVKSNGTRICLGDSGGGAISTALFNFDVVIGLAHSFTSGAYVPTCPDPGSTESWTAMYGKVNWIETQLATFDSVLGGLIHGPPCSEGSTSNGIYVQCW